MRDSGNEFHTFSDAYEHTVALPVDIRTSKAKASYILNPIIISIDKQAIPSACQIRTRVDSTFQIRRSKTVYE